MKMKRINLDNTDIEVYSLNTVVVGSGAAGLNALVRVHNFGQQDIALVTEGLNMGTSRNTGSDKQTYYKITQSGREPDSVYEMAETLFSGGSMDGDIALVEAALSTRCFYHLVEMGVPFPHNRLGEYVGYKTDHDPRRRATSVGPLTSKLMTEKLEDKVMEKDIKIFDGYQVIAILTDPAKDQAVGLMALNLNEMDRPEKRYIIFNCTNIIYATGGPAGIYGTSVYPESQTGASGIAFEAGAIGKNLTESQYGIASVKFRWNLSGSYQQVLPRYISTDRDGNDEKEFLNDYFEDPGSMLDAIFLKGYQWPFDPGKIDNYGSSLIDLLVYQETVIKGRRVWLDFTSNPGWGSKEGELDFNLLNSESYDYLQNSNLLFGTPVERLAAMNSPAVQLYKNNGIDLKNEYMEISVSAQHNNGGLYGNIWWESNLKHFFPIGEVNGTHGIYRPGGSALNSGQVGGLRAAQYIAINYQESPLELQDFINCAGEQIKGKLKLGERFVESIGEKSNILDMRRKIGERMTRDGAVIRSLKSAARGAEIARQELVSMAEETRLSSVKELGFAFQNYDLLLTQFVYLSAIKDYIESGGRSRGSYLVKDPDGKLPAEKLTEDFRFALDDGCLKSRIQKVQFVKDKCIFTWDDVKPIPEENIWFENVWNDYIKGNIIR